MKKLVLAALAWAAVAGSAHAQDWVLAAVTDDIILGFDQSRMSTASVRPVWTILVHRRPQVEAGGQAYDYTLTRYRVDCADERMSITTINYYVIGDTSPVETVNFDDDQWDHPPPESIGRSMIFEVCDGSPEETLGITSPHDFGRVGRQVLIDPAG